MDILSKHIAWASTPQNKKRWHFGNLCEKSVISQIAETIISRIIHLRYFLVKILKIAHKYNFGDILVICVKNLWHPKVRKQLYPTSSTWDLSSQSLENWRNLRDHHGILSHATTVLSPILPWIECSPILNATEQAPQPGKLWMWNWVPVYRLATECDHLNENVLARTLQSTDRVYPSKLELQTMFRHIWENHRLDQIITISSLKMFYNIIMVVNQYKGQVCLFIKFSLPGSG